MSIDTRTIDSIPLDVLADGEALAEAIKSGRKPDPEVVKRVRARAAKVTETIHQKHGVLDIGAKAICDLRDS